MIANCKNGVSSWGIHRSIGVSQKTAWFMLHRIRLAMQDEDTGGKLGGDVEVDETFIGGKSRNMHHAKRERVIKGTGGKGKVVVRGLLERHGKDGHSTICLNITTRLRKRDLQGHVREHVEAGSNVYTDTYKSSIGLDRDYVHGVIDHAEKYVGGQIHTNGCENFWSLLKRALKGTYVAVEPFHLFRYLDEQVFRFNNRREMNDADRFSEVIRNIVGRQLTYAEVIAAINGGAATA
jgi:hypothetical protein